MSLIYSLFGRTRPVFIVQSAGLALSLSVAGCLVDGGEPTPWDDPNNYGDYTVTAQLQYQYVPYDAQRGGLDYDATEVRTLRGVKVALLKAANDEELDVGVADEEGKISFAYHGPAEVKLWVYAQTEVPSIRVEDNTANNAVYVLESDTVDASTTPSLTVVAETGWDGSAYGARHAAPFAILDAAYTAAGRFLDETTNPPSFPALRINWSVNNGPYGGDKEDGDIGTSHWDGEELYILGMEDVDTDEFDSHVIVHEWGHYFESKVSRADSIGGPHTLGDVLDPRVAFGEGWGNALSAIILDPDVVYTDSMDREQSDGFGFDLEANYKGADRAPGWYSEESVQTILFDLYDGANESFDSTALGLDPLYQVLSGPQKTQDALTTLFPFIASLKAANTAQASAIDALVTYHTANADLGVDAIADAYGTGETHDAGLSAVLPLYPSLEAGKSKSFSLDGRLEYNKLAQNRYFSVIGDGGSLNAATSSSEDVDIYVYQAGKIVAAQYTQSGNESVSFSTTSGKRYIINVNGWGSTNGTYSVSLTLSR